MIFSRTPKNNWIPRFYLFAFVILVILIFEQLVQLLVAQLFTDIYSVLPFSFDIFFTETLATMFDIPSWIIILVIIAICIALIFWVVEKLATYNERQEELFIGDPVDRHLYKAIFTRPQVNYTNLPLYTGDFMRDNKGTRADEKSDSTAGELYRFMHSALFSLPLDEVFYLRHIKITKENRHGLYFNATAITNRRNLLVKTRKKFILPKNVNNYAEMTQFIKSINGED